MDKTRGWIAFAMVAGTLALFTGFPLLGSKMEQNIMMLIIGALGTNLTNVISYYFGSSVGSQQKDGVISGMVRDSECRPHRRVINSQHLRTRESHSSEAE
jgi:hypothetical protein